MTQDYADIIVKALYREAGSDGLADLMRIADALGEVTGFVIGLMPEGKQGDALHRFMEALKTSRDQWNAEEKVPEVTLQ